MGERRHARSRSAFRRRIRGDRRGVVAVVGTLLALLVFFSLFGIFITEYVPLWMEENESQLSYGLQTSLATLKSGMDEQYILNGALPSYSVPFTVSSDSVPLLAQPTVASLSYLSGCPDGFYASNGTPVKIGSCDFERLSLTTATGGTGQNHPYNVTFPTNYVDVYVPNRYYTAMTFVLESDGITVSQTNGHQVMLVPPPFNVSKNAGNLSVQGSLFGLLGNASSFTGLGSKAVTSQYLSSSVVSSTGRFLTPGGVARSFNVTMQFGVHQLCAWYNYLYNATYSAFGSASSTLWTLKITGQSGAVTAPASITTCIEGITSTYDLTLKLFNVNYAVAFVAESQVSFNAGGL